MEYFNRIPSLSLFLSLFIYLYRSKTIPVTYNLKEHSEIGSVIGDLRLIEKLSDDSSVDVTKLDYKMLKANRFVSINMGKLFVKNDIDREKICIKSHQCCCIDLLVFIYRQQIQTDYLDIRIMIEDINDHAPSWSQSNIVLNIPEHTKLGTKYRLPAAIDPDSSAKFSITKYRLEYLEKKSESIFSLIFNSETQDRNLYQLWLKVNADIDREVVNKFELRLIAEDSGVPSLSGTITLIINITDINDNEPYFENTVTEVHIKENNQPDDYLCKMVAKDRDSSDTYKLTYSFGYSLSQEEISKFHIDERSGKVYVKKSLDYENDPSSFNLPIQATDGSNVAESTLIVTLQNENDNPPIITILPHVNSSFNALMVEENSASDKTLATITTTDIDNRTTIISCESPTPGFILQKVDAQIGSFTKYALSLTKTLDRENEAWLQVIIICRDDGYPQQTTRKILKIEVLDQNDCVPKFMNSLITISIDENLPKGTFVTRVNASDSDSGINAQLVYEIDETVTRLFVIDRKTGVIRTNTVFNREKTAEEKIMVRVYDKDNHASNNPAEKVLSSSIVVKVLIHDLNDCAPVFNKVFYEFSIPEESLPRMYVGSVSAVDGDIDLENRQITFSMIVKPFEKNKFFSQAYFYISPDGGIYTTNRMLDRELFGMFSFSVEARDGSNAKHVVTVDVVIKIEDVNDNHPKWIHPPTPDLNVNISQEETVGRIITVLRATDADIKENSELHFEIVQGNEYGLFRLDRKSGSLYMAKTPTKKGSDVIRLLLKVTDNGKIPLSNTTTLKVRILRDVSWLYFEGRHLDKDLVVMICMISVTLIVSGILVVAIILLKCKHCFKTNDQIIPGSKDNRPENPDGRSSPTVSELDNSPQKMSSDMSLYHNHICRSRGFMYEAQPGLAGFQPINKPDSLPLYYTFKSRTSIPDTVPNQNDLYLDKQSPQIITFHNPHYPITPDYRTLPSSSQDNITMQFLKNQVGLSSPLTTTVESSNIYCGAANTNVFNTLNYRHANERKVPPSVKWSDMVEDKGIYEAFCRTENNNNNNSSQMSKDQITSFV